MNWLLTLIAIAASEHLAHGFLSNDATWELALSAKYLSLAVVLQLLLAETKQRPLLFRSLVALFCIGAWVDFVGHCVWNVWTFDSSLPVMVGFSVWLIHAARRGYDVESDPIIPGRIYILIHKPKNTWAVIKALIGFPADSVSVYALTGRRGHSGATAAPSRSILLALLFYRQIFLSILGWHYPPTLKKC